MRTKQQRRWFTKRYQQKQLRLHGHFADVDVSKYARGRMRKMSWHDHGPCEMCGNPRRSKWNSDKYRLTRQELKSNLSYKEYQTEDYYEITFDCT